MISIPPLASAALPNGTSEVAAAPRSGEFGQGHEVALGKEASAFVQALGASVPEVQAAAVPDAGALSSQLASGMQDLSVRLAGWQRSHAAPGAQAPSAASPAGSSPSLTKAMEDAVAGMQGAYAFAIETTLASRGSTELTKVFNTLLKGQ